MFLIETALFIVFIGISSFVIRILSAVVIVTYEEMNKPDQSKVNTSSQEYLQRYMPKQN